VPSLPSQTLNVCCLQKRWCNQALQATNNGERLMMWLKGRITRKFRDVVKLSRILPFNKSYLCK